MNIWLCMLLIIISLILGRQHGWLTAHQVISTECKRLGKFYVNKEVFECKLIAVVKESK